MIEIFALMKVAGLIGLTGGGGGAYVVYRTMPETKLKIELRQAFQSAHIGIKHTSVKNGNQKKEYWLYPNIRKAKVEHDRKSLVFGLPKGLDPELVTEKDWIFEQYFGPLTRLEGDARNMKLTIFEKDLEPFDYNYDDIRKQTLKPKVPIYVGKNYDGHFVYDMAEWPHLLVSGETGSGKSTALRSIIATLILSIPPANLELHMADLKRTEFGRFRGIAKSVVVSPEDLNARLMKIETLLQKRGDDLDELDLTNIYEMKSPPPTVILCIDEVALLRSEKDIMERIEKIAMIGRALGVFLILSMQRADAEVLEGRLKQCLTVRISFRQPDEINSKIAIGNSEASKINIKDRGRLFIRHETLEMMQAPYLAPEKVKSLLEQFKRKDEPVKVTKHKKNPKVVPINAEFSVLPEEDDDQ